MAAETHRASARTFISFLDRLGVVFTVLASAMNEMKDNRDLLSVLLCATPCHRWEPRLAEIDAYKIITPSCKMAICAY
jgi:hypothetical protein